MAAAPVGREVPRIWGDDQPAPTEVYFLSPIANVTSIMRHGILSRKRAAQFNPVDISNHGVQKHRGNKIVVNPDRIRARKKALNIHRCANLYMRAHNAMLLGKKPEERKTYCVLRIDPRLLTREEVVATDMNAARGGVTFSQARTFTFSQESAKIHRDRGEYNKQEHEEWVRAEPYKKSQTRYGRKMGIRQAEVLAPYKVHPSFIRGAYVADAAALERLKSVLPDPSPIPIDVHRSLFGLVRGGALGAPTTQSALRNDQHPDLVYELPTSSDSEVEGADAGAGASSEAGAPRTSPQTEVQNSIINRFSPVGEAPEAPALPAGAGSVSATPPRTPEVVMTDSEAEGPDDPEADAQEPPASPAGLE